MLLEAPIADLLAAAARLLAVAQALDKAPEVISVGAVRLALASGELSSPGIVEVLSPTLSPLAAALMRQPGSVVPHTELLRATGYYLGVDTTRRLANAIARLRCLMPGEIRCVTARGYRWTPPDDCGDRAKSGDPAPACHAGVGARTRATGFRTLGVAATQSVAGHPTAAQRWPR